MDPNQDRPEHAERQLFAAMKATGRQIPVAALEARPVHFNARALSNCVGNGDAMAALPAAALGAMMSPLAL